MNDNFQCLLNDFSRIQKKGWIKSNTKSTGGIGITFEKELGNNENNSVLPDYKDIEIKCLGINSLYPLTLFSACFDGPSKNELYRIVQIYGTNDNTFKNQKVIYANLNCYKPYCVNDKYYFKLEIDRKEEKVYVVISDINNNLIEKKSYIKFDSIKKHLMTKLENLALIYGLKRYENHNYYYKYTDISLYKIKKFDTFIDLIEDKTIIISMIFRYNKSERHYGKPSSKNIVFAIKTNNIKKLFERIN